MDFPFPKTRKRCFFKGSITPTRTITAVGKSSYRYFTKRRVLSDRHPKVGSQGRPLVGGGDPFKTDTGDTTRATRNILRATGMNRTEGGQGFSPWRKKRRVCEHIVWFRLCVRTRGGSYHTGGATIRKKTPAGPCPNCDLNDAS
jgi:hypothetical protein